MKCLISVMAGQFSNSQMKQLESVLRRHYRSHVSASKLVIVWLEFKPDQVFTNYQPSRSSIVSIECDDDFPQQKRVTMLQACAADWCAMTGQHPNELMLSLIEAKLM